MKVIVDFGVLMRYASAKGKAEMEMKRNPTEENKLAYEKAKKEHDEYHKICLEADEMNINMTYGDITETISGKYNKNKN